MHKRVAKETRKRYTSRETMGVMQPKIWFKFFWDMWDPLFPEQTIIDFSTSPFQAKSYLRFPNKIVSAQRNINRIQILCTVPPNNCFLRGEFLFVHRKRHARFKSVFSSYQSWC